jgi:hypothetical protein
MLYVNGLDWTERRMATQLPDVIAMLFADDIHRDPITKKCFVLGTYSSIAAPVFPWKQTALIVYLAFTGGKGTIPFRMRLVNANGTQPPIFESEMVIHFPDPAAVVEPGFYHPNVVFPQAGEYHFELLSDGQLLGERRLFLRFGSLNGRR